MHSCCYSRYKIGGQDFLLHSFLYLQQIDIWRPTGFPTAFPAHTATYTSRFHIITRILSGRSRGPGKANTPKQHDREPKHPHTCDLRHVLPGEHITTPLKNGYFPGECRVRTSQPVRRYPDSLGGLQQEHKINHNQRFGRKEKKGNLRSYLRP
ncbi:hypothetical protein ES708_31808 [subsurface metagenome]